jgi:hypothetical protein
MFVEKIYKMGCLEGNGVPVPYMGRTVPKGLFNACAFHNKSFDVLAKDFCRMPYGNNLQKIVMNFILWYYRL